MKNIIRRWLGIDELEKKARTQISQTDLHKLIITLRQEAEDTKFICAKLVENNVKSEEFLDNIIKRIKDKQL